MMKLAPSILSADFSNLLKDVKIVEEAGCEYLHIDVMDGHFVPNITIGPLVVESLKGKTDMIFDVHLMIEEPEKYIEGFSKAGADIITVHQEAPVHLHRVIQLIKAQGVKAGVSLNPATPISTLEYVLEDLDMVLLMSVNPGFGGQKYIPAMTEKIRKLKEMIAEKGLKVDIQVDGGINPENVREIVSAGADIIVAGSAIFKTEDVSKAVQNLRMKGEG
ncbi:ribulose-phosphate 3-epimerase [Isachenkonia alkalipeptolytica]|uniref:Ribulose-phosphate 3-epimerase n=1 Tax=Isachenkonia alkalipeptolytica TaxID=2565777 RepID=A0AA43XMW3_9CLOT|nr:ribulose-phosphate 3-epimerase [Isachenkonia alkalipeptolytica]